MTCLREGCERDVPPPRRKYCSIECYRIVNNARSIRQTLERQRAWRKAMKPVKRG